MAAPDSTPPPPPHSGEDIDFSFPAGTADRLVRLRESFGDCFALTSLDRPHHPCYLVSDPALVSQVLGKGHRHYIKGVGIDRVNILLGRGLMVSQGDLWKTQRRMMQPAFRKPVVQHLAPLIEQVTRCHTAAWQTGQTIDVVEMTSRATLDFVLNSIFGNDLEKLERRPDGNPFNLVAQEGERNLLFARQFRALASIVQALVDERRAQGTQADDFLAALMDATDRDGTPMSDRQLVDEVLTLIVAGHETTASALSWTWILLAQDIESQQRVCDEADRVSGDITTWPGQLVYTRAVLNEAMRLYPPGWMLARRAVADHRMGAYAIPEGADILISPYVIHRHAGYWQNPHDFDPDRFLTMDPAAEPAFIPFSSGPRNCIGEHLAMLEMILHVTLVAKDFTLSLPAGAGVDMEAKINLRPAPPILMDVQSR